MTLIHETLKYKDNINFDIAICYNDVVVTYNKTSGDQWRHVIIYRKNEICINTKKNIKKHSYMSLQRRDNPQLD